VSDQVSTEIDRQPQALCGTREAFCVCFLERQHAGPHVCSCGGSWEIDADGAFHVHSIPRTALPDVEVRT
jgi:hypothetical protein